MAAIRIQSMVELKNGSGREIGRDIFWGDEEASAQYWETVTVDFHLCDPRALV